MDRDLDLDRLTGVDHASALGRRAGLAAAALAAANRAAARAGKGDGHFARLEDYVADVARRTVCITLLAGSGSRWIKSLAAAAAMPADERPSCFDPSFDPAWPRGLYRVRDFLGVAPARADGRMAIAAYSLAAVRGLGRHLLVVRGFEDEIDADVLRPLGIGPADRRFFTQEAPFGKPLGHGDAAWQCRALWKNADYVVTNFGGDANSRATALSSLLVLDALSASPDGPLADLLIPAARFPSPAYPIGLDEAGLPRTFGHAKLQGKAAGMAEDETERDAEGDAGGEAYTNVGVRVYRAPALLAGVEYFRARWWVDGTGYAIPGNDPEGHEFALDNVDAELASRGRARILAACRPEELTPAKSLGDIPAFERAIAKVTAEDAGLLRFQKAGAVHKETAETQRRSMEAHG
jgi:hypothetical protein